MTKPVRPPFPEVITNSMRKDFTACHRKFELSDILHLKPKRTSIHLHAGGVFAKGIEVTRKQFYVEGKPAADAVLAGWQQIVLGYEDYEIVEDTAKTVERMCGALDYYFTVWPLGQDFIEPYRYGNGAAGIEFSFTHPLPILHPETGNPLLYYGRYDMLGQRNDGTIWGVDEKTASKLGDSWVNSWALDSQMTSYVWGAREYGHRIEGMIVRGISILKTSYGHAQSLQKRTDWEVQRWYNQLLRDVRAMIQCWHDGYYDYDLADGCKNYGGCMYREACKMKNPDIVLNADFEYNPHEPWKEH